MNTIHLGKSTLARILLRIVDYDNGALLVNGHDIRKYKPSDYHSHVSAVFQGFSKFNSTVKENVGLGNVDKISYMPTIDNAVRLAQADMLVESLPYGLKTMLTSSGGGGGGGGGYDGFHGSLGFGSTNGAGTMSSMSRTQHHDLSGGEVSKNHLPLPPPSHTITYCQFRFLPLTCTFTCVA